MAMNSVNTNVGALVALQALNRTNTALETTQKRVSTGYRVADAKDDGAAYAVAQTVRADMAGLTSANEQLGGTQGILDTTLSSLTKVSNNMAAIKGVLVKLADGTISGDQRDQYVTQYNSLRTQAQNFIADSYYNGRTLLSTDTANGGGDINTTRNEQATLYTLTASDSATAMVTATAPVDATAAQAALAPGGDFDTVMETINTSLNAFGADSNYIKSQISYNSEKLDALTSGLGSLIDADLAKESASLQALQIRQQLGTQSLGIANKAPQALLSLFQG